MALASVPTPTISISTTGVAGSPIEDCTWVAIPSETYLTHCSYSYGMQTIEQSISPSTLTATFLNTNNAFIPTNTEGPFYGALRVGAPLRLRVSGTFGIGYTAYGPFLVFYGYISSITVDRTTDPTSSRVRIEAVDIMGVWSRRRITRTTSSGATVSSNAYLCLVSDLGYTLTYVGGGLDGYPPTVTSENVFITDYLGRLADADDAAVFATASASYGAEINFRSWSELDRGGPLTLKPENSPGGDWWNGNWNIPYHRISERTLGDSRIVNEVTISRVGGSAVTVSDSTSQTSYGIRNMTKGGVLLNNDTYVTTLANYHLARRKEPLFTHTWVEVDLGKLGSNTLKDTAGMAFFLSYRQLGDRYTVYFDGSPISYCMIGTTHTVSSPHTWIVRAYLSPLELH